MHIRKVFIIVSDVLATLAAVVVIVAVNISSRSDVEKSVLYNVSSGGATLWAFESIPEEAMEAAQAYIAEIAAARLNTPS